MRRNLVSLGKWGLYLVLSLLVVCQVAMGFADSPDPGLLHHNVEIEGAKIISEGGYLWFQVTNHETYPLQIAIQYPSDVIVKKEIPATLTLEANETSDFYFQAPYYWNGTGDYTQDAEKELKFHFKISDHYQNYTINDENIDFTVKVVPLNRGFDTSLLYLTIFAVAAVIASVTILAVKLKSPEKRSQNSLRSASARSFTNPFQKQSIFPAVALRTCVARTSPMNQTRFSTSAS